MIPYKPLPKDAGNNEMQEFATPFKAIVTTSSENATVSSVITLDDNCTTIEVGTVGGPAVIRWVATGDTAGSVISAASGANFDNSVPQNYWRRFAVPIEKTVLQASIVGLNKQYGLYNRIAIKTVGIASVLLTQY